MIMIMSIDREFDVRWVDFHTQTKFKLRILRYLSERMV